MLIHSQVGQEGSDFGFPHLTGMFLVMEKNITLNPLTNLSGTVVIQGRVVYEAKDVNLNSRRLARRVKYRDVFHNISNFGTNAVVAQSQCITHLIQQFELSHGRLPALLAFVFRLRFLSLTHCFLNNHLFYTHQKRLRQRAFRVSNSS